MSEKLAELPATEKKLRDGSLSLDQAALVTRGASADPGAEARLLRTAGQPERHHVDEYAEHQLTTYEILGNACPHHHDLITYDHYDVIVNPDGSWTLRPPEERRDTDAA